MPEPEGAGEVVAGRYEIGEIAGRGGSATVYRARDLRDGSDVALKVLHAEFSGSRAAERFSVEIRLLEGFAHPNILPVLDSGEWNGRPFYVMRFVAGESLQERLRRERRLSFPEVVRIGRALCDALGYAHARKVVHRDVKPANVMLAGNEVFLTDFGIAKALEPLPGQVHSTTGVARGTRAYMSPEQAMADRDLDHRSDIFSLGCVLYEMIAGQNPFHSADESRMLMRRVTDVPDPLKRHRDGVPPGLEAAVMKALAKEPADRWGTVGEMGEGLGGVGFGSRVRRYAFGGRLVAAGSVGAAVVAVSLFMYAASSEPRARACDLEPLSSLRTPRLALAVAADPDEAGQPIDTRAVRRGLSDAAGRWDGVSVRAWNEEMSDSGPAAGTRCLLLGGGHDLLLTAQLQRTDVGDSLDADMRVVSQEGVYAWRSRVANARLSNALTWAPIVREAVAHQLGTLRGSDVDTVVIGFQAWRDCVRGMVSLERGWLDSAATFFESAQATVFRYGCPEFGTAIVTALARPRAHSEWRETAVRARSWGGARSRSDERIAASLIERADSRFAAACKIPLQTTSRGGPDHVSLLVAAECLRVDSTVVMDPRGAARFQSSWMESRRLLERALDEAPAGFARLVLPRLSLVSPTSPSVRWGWRTGDRIARLAAYPEWESDSLAHKPKDRRFIENAVPGAVPPTLGTAILMGKQLQADAAAGWVSRARSSAAAHYALALALEQQGELSSTSSRDTSALSELELASISSDEQVAPDSLLETRSRVLLKTWRLDELEALVDSSLSRGAGMDDRLAEVVGALALLQGRVSDALPLLERTLWKDTGVPMSAELRRELTELSALASIGCCASRLSALDSSIRRRMELEYDSTTRTRVANHTMTRPVSLSAHCSDWTPVLAVHDSTDFLVRAQLRVARGDRAAARSLLEAVDRSRVHASSADVAVDYLAQEALLFLAIGDMDAARRRVDGWQLTWTVNSAFEIRQIAQAGAIIRLLLLNERIDTTGDSASKSALALPRAAALWRKGDPWLVRSLGLKGSIEGICSATPPLMG